MDFAQRAHDHNYKMDPIVRSRLDSDAYKLFMGATIYEKHPSTQVLFQLTNRSTNVRLAEHISVGELREQLDHAKTLKYTPSEIIHLRGQSYYGHSGLFKDGYINRVAISKLPEYELSVNEETGQFDLRSGGDWMDAKEWEIHFLSIVNELYSRSQMRRLSKAQLDIMYARAKVRLYAKLERIVREAPELTISEFGTRRRHSFLWQRWVIETMKDVLGKQFVGTSNMLHAKELEVEVKGTIAHEMSMVYAALAAKDGDEAIRQSQYQMLKDVQSVLPEDLRIFLPDTFGTTQFLENAPDWLQWWKGFRPDSKESVEAGEEAIRFWKSMGQDPAKKLLILSDGLDVDLDGKAGNGADMIDIHKALHGQIIDTYGWGTNATNDFRGMVPGMPDLMAPISIVAKAVSANGHATVKISDNPSKASSIDPTEKGHYLTIFGQAGIGESRRTLV
jgi:nicotinate phosphoribosyltransferase